MFGLRVDYYLLRRLAHRDNHASQQDLEAEVLASTFSLDDARDYLRRVESELFRGDFSVDAEKSYLDIGCGMGRLSLGLAAEGARKVTGIDIVARNVEQAKLLAHAQLSQDQRPVFIHADIHDWDSNKKFDVIVALGALEHIHDLEAFLSAIPRYLKPGGRCYVSIEPFHSPFGDHMMHFFRPYIPWTGLIFNEQAILQLRREVFRPNDPAERFEQIEGGLNMVRYGRYRRYVQRAGMRFVANRINPQLRTRKYMAPLRWVSALLTRVPGIRDYFIVVDYAVLSSADE